MWWALVIVFWASGGITSLSIPVQDATICKAAAKEVLADAERLTVYASCIQVRQ